MQTNYGMEGIEAKMIAHSSSAQAVPIITVQLTYPRFIHSEIMTHRVFSRNASSSRAIPVEKMLDQVRNNPASPVYWGSNKPGMQAGQELEYEDLRYVKDSWLLAARDASSYAERMAERGLHKQIANRILEPWQFMKTIVTATDWENFFKLRLHPDAQPEFRHLAILLNGLIIDSVPKYRGFGDWHLPYVTDDERSVLSVLDCRKISSARCARVSYLNHDQSEPDVDKDIALHDSLLNAGHMSPFEHVACPLYSDNWKHVRGTTHITKDGDVYSGNLRDWIQYRQLL